MENGKEVFLQMRVREDLLKVLQEDAKRFDTSNFNGSIALHFSNGTVQKVHTTVVS